MHNTKDIYIIGAGGFGHEVRSMLSDAHGTFGGYIDDDISKTGVLHTVAALNEKVPDTSSDFLVAIGSSSTRQQIVARLKVDLNFPVIVHHTTLLQQPSSIKFGKGTIVCAANIFTCDIELGEFCLINLNCTIGHDVKMGNYCSLMPSVNISGGVTLGDGVFVGTGATVLQGITIGQGATVGAGAVVTKDVAPGTVVVGIPAK